MEIKKRKDNTFPGIFWVISREIKPLAALYPPHTKKVIYRATISVVAGGGMLMPTAFAPISNASV